MAGSLRTFLICGLFGITFLVMLQWQHRMNYVAISRNTLRYAYKNLDSMLSEFEDGGDEKHRTNTRGLRVPGADEAPMPGKKLYSNSGSGSSFVEGKKTSIQRLSRKNTTVANKKLTRDDQKKRAKEPSKSNGKARCFNLGSTFNATGPSTFTTLVVVPVPESTWKGGDSKTVEKAHSTFVKQFSSMFLQISHLLFAWNLSFNGNADMEKEKLQMLKSVVKSLLSQVRKSEQTSFVTFFVCVGNGGEDYSIFQKKLEEDITPYLKGFGQQRKRIVVSSLQTNFIAHKIGGDKTRYCPNNRKAIKKYGCDCSWATSARSCVNDKSNCFKTCCCKYVDPTGLDRLTNGFMVQYQKDYEALGEIYAIGGYKIGAHRKTGLSCFTKVAEDFPDQKSTSNLHALARVYKHEIGTGKRMDGTHSSGEAYAVCDLVEMPLSINPNKKTARVISLIVSASFLGDGYLTSPAARKFLRGTILDKNDDSGSFGFNPYFTSEEATFQNDKYVSFKNMAYKFWKNDSLCFTGRDASTRPTLLYDGAKLYDKIATSEKNLTADQTSFYASYGSLMTPMKLGSMPPWEFDMDLDFIMDLYVEKSSPKKLQEKCETLIKKVRSEAPKHGFFVSGHKCGTKAGLDYTKNKVKCVVNHVRKKDVGVFFPHWSQTCHDLKECKNCWILKPESWDTCVRRIRNMTKHNVPLKGWVRKEGVKFEVACRALNKKNLEVLKSSTRVPIADPQGQGETLFVNAFAQYSKVLSEQETLSEYGDFIPNPWKCADKAIKAQ